MQMGKRWCSAQDSRQVCSGCLSWWTSCSTSRCHSNKIFKDNKDFCLRCVVKLEVIKAWCQTSNKMKPIWAAAKGTNVAVGQESLTVILSVQTAFGIYINPNGSTLSSCLKQHNYSLVTNLCQLITYKMPACMTIAKFLNRLLAN